MARWRQATIGKGWRTVPVAVGALLAVTLIAAAGGGGSAAIGGATFQPNAAPAGLLVTSLRSGGAEAAAGLRVGDVIDRIDTWHDPTPAMLRRAEIDGDVRLHLAARGDGAPRTLLLHAAEVPREDIGGRGR